MSDYSPDIYYPENEIARLRADLIAEQGYRAAAEEIAKRRGEMVDALIAERDEARREVCVSDAIIRYHDPPDEMTIEFRARRIAAECGWDCFKEEVKP